MRRQIAILIDPGDTWGRHVITGILAAVRHQLPWDLLIDPRDDQWRYRVPRRWNGDGIIGAIRDEKTARHVRSLGLPIVNVSSWGGPEWGWPRVNTDDSSRARLAFEHFRDRGFEHYAYYGPPSQRYSDQRGVAFADVVSDAGFDCAIFKIGSGQPSRSSVEQKTKKWLGNLPRPVAIFAADPHPALRLTEICHAAGIRVPEEIAILAGDTDDLLCAASDPPLSSIVLASERIGSESVRLLDAILNKKPIENPTVVIPPAGTIQRRSTDILAVNDPHFVKALRFIREQAHAGIQVNDVLRVVPMSRRLLEQRFAHYLKRTPADEIRRIKMERVKQLLSSTDQSLELIAQSSGYSSVSHMCYTFRKAIQQSPMEYRKTSRKGGLLEQTSFAEKKI